MSVAVIDGQISFSDYAPTHATENRGQCDGNNIIAFPNLRHKNARINYSPNYRTGGKQTADPIKDMEDVRKVCQYLKEKNKKYYLLFVLGINLGLRCGELLQIRMKDIFFPDGRIRYIDDVRNTKDALPIYQSKVGYHREVFLNKACVEAIKECYPHTWSRNYSDSYLFPSPVYKDKPLEVDSVRKILKEACKACDVPGNIGTHTMRKTFSYMVLTLDCVPNTRKNDITVLQQILGHKSAATTMHYAGVAAEEFKALYHALETVIQPWQNHQHS